MVISEEELKRFHDWLHAKGARGFLSGVGFKLQGHIYQRTMPKSAQAVPSFWRCDL